MISASRSSARFSSVMSPHSDPAPVEGRLLHDPDAPAAQKVLGNGGLPLVAPRQPLGNPGLLAPHGIGVFAVLDPVAKQLLVAHARLHRGGRARIELAVLVVEDHQLVVTVVIGKRIRQRRKRVLHQPARPFGILLGGLHRGDVGRHVHQNAVRAFLVDLGADVEIDPVFLAVAGRVEDLAAERLAHPDRLADLARDIRVAVVAAGKLQKRPARHLLQRVAGPLDERPVRPHDVAGPVGDDDVVRHQLGHLAQPLQPVARLRVVGHVADHGDEPEIGVARPAARRHRRLVNLHLSHVISLEPARLRHAVLLGLIHAAVEDLRNVVWQHIGRRLARPPLHRHDHHVRGPGRNAGIATLGIQFEEQLRQGTEQRLEPVRRQPKRLFGAFPGDIGLDPADRHPDDVGHGLQQFDRGLCKGRGDTRVVEPDEPAKLAVMHEGHNEKRLDILILQRPAQFAVMVPVIDIGKVNMGARQKVGHPWLENLDRKVLVVLDRRECRVGHPLVGIVEPPLGRDAENIAPVSAGNRADPFDPLLQKGIKIIGRRTHEIGKKPRDERLIFHCSRMGHVHSNSPETLGLRSTIQIRHL